MTVSGGFVLQARTVRVACDLVDKETGERPYDGLWAEVRRNLTNGERDALKEDADAIDDRAEALTKAYHERAEALQRAVKESEGDAARQTELIVELTEITEQYVLETSQIAQDRFFLIAPHIHRWNLQTIDDASGDLVPVPSPQSNAVAAFRHIDAQIVGWLLGAVLGAYRRGFPIGSQKSGAQPEPTPEPSAAKPKASGSNSRRSRKTSSSPSPSTFEA